MKWVNSGKALTYSTTQVSLAIFIIYEQPGWIPTTARKASASFLSRRRTLQIPPGGMMCPRGYFRAWIRAQVPWMPSWALSASSKDCTTFIFTTHCLRTALTCISWHTDSVWTSLCCRYHIHCGNLFLSPWTEHFCTFNFYNLPLCIWENTENQDIFFFFFNSLKNKVKARSCELQSSQSYLLYVHGCDCLSGVIRLDGEEGYCGRDSRDWLTSELAVSDFSGDGAGEKSGES